MILEPFDPNAIEVHDQRGCTVQLDSNVYTYRLDNDQLGLLLFAFLAWLAVESVLRVFKR